MPSDRFARRVFTGAGIYGIAVLAPLYGAERVLGATYPPPITHPEFFYGFLGAAIAWQIVFLIIGRDPERYRPLMLPSIVEKVAYGAAVVFVLVPLGRTTPGMLPTAIVDLILAVLFALAHRRTAARPWPRPSN